MKIRLYNMFSYVIVIAMAQFPYKETQVLLLENCSFPVGKLSKQCSSAALRLQTGEDATMFTPSPHDLVCRNLT